MAARQSPSPRPSRRAGMRDEAPNQVPIWPLLPVLLIMLAFFAYPLFRTVFLSFAGGELSIQHYVEIFTTPVYLRVLVVTVMMSLVGTAISVTLGFPVAYVLATARPFARNAIFLLVLVPWLVTELVRNFAWVIILHPSGVLTQALEATGFTWLPSITTGSRAAVMVGTVYVQLPLAILPIYAVLARADLSLVDAARSLGANTWHTTRSVLIPLSAPGILAASAMVFLTTLAFYVAPMILGGPSDIFMANLIDVQVNRLVNWELGSALSVVLVLAGLVVIAIARHFIGLEWLTGRFVDGQSNRSTAT